MAPNIKPISNLVLDEHHDCNRIRCAILGCGMMGQEHVSYIMGYSSQIRVDFLCDPFEDSLNKAKKIMTKFRGDPILENLDPRLLTDESDLLRYVDSIDLLVIASPNYLHTPTNLSPCGRRVRIALQSSTHPLRRC